MGFLEQLAATLYGKYGDGVSSLYIILPTRRARLFLNEALSRLAGRPLWQPAYTSVDTIMERLSGLAVAGPEKLLTELYKAYSAHHTENFDTFYYWGETLLADFDQIDKYLVDACRLFANINDLKELDTAFSYLDPEQRAVVERFWSAFSGSAAMGAASPEKEHFLTVWNTLGAIYQQFRAALEAQGIAYTGMAHRAAAEKLLAAKRSAMAGCGEGGLLPEDDSKYIVAGFNALTECEKALFDHLQQHSLAEFYWDYDDYYVGRREQEAGLFLRRNITRYPQPAPFSTNNFGRDKEIVAVGAPSDSLQAKYAANFVAAATSDRNTAIVLTDENLLVPVLHSVSTVAEDINITMGYPLRQTLAYSFAERVLQLQSGARRHGAHGGGAGAGCGERASRRAAQALAVPFSAPAAPSNNARILFRHTDVAGILTHPFLRDHATAEIAALVRGIEEGRLIYVDSEMLSITPLLTQIFSAPEGWEQMATYLTAILTAIARLPYEGDDRALRTEYFATMVEAITKVANSLKNCEVELSDRVFVSLLRRHLQGVRIPYEGEPLRGVQIMGILETRNLDFDNVLILSANDDTFPGNRMGAPSFIPYNLRAAYGLPDASHHEGVYAYYFYRLLQRACNVHIVYCSTSDERRTGEESRYIYQLRYESGHKIQERRINLEINHTQDNAITIEKRGRALEELGRMLDGSHRLSPTALSAYVECPLKFYFRSVAGLRPREELTEEIEAPMLGTILHKAMELLYKELVGIPHPQERIAALIGSPTVDAAVESAIRSEYLSRFDLPREEYGGNLLLAADIVKKYINSAILPFDSRGEGIIIGLEAPLEARFAFAGEAGGGERASRPGLTACAAQALAVPSYAPAASPREVVFYGKADRTERLPDDTLRVVDYKTGGAATDFGGIRALFSPRRRERNGAAFQTLLYGLMATRMGEARVQPALYYVRKLSAEGYSPLLFDSSTKTPVENYGAVREEFETLLGETLAELFDPDTPFAQCRDTETCKTCDFSAICRR